jgi:tetratricopeptide (TPR) repeat protein
MKRNRFYKTIFSLSIFMLIGIMTFAQDCPTFEAFPGGEKEGLKTHVLYRDLIQKEEYDAAFPMWEKLMESSAAGHVYHFIDGVVMYNYFMERDAEDSAKTVEYKQMIVDLYEQRLVCMSPERGDSNVVMESFAYQLASMGYEDTDKTLAVFEKAIEMNGNKTSAYILAYYGDFATFMFGNDALPKDKTRDIYFQLEKIKDANIENTDYSDNWEYVVTYFKPYENYLFDCAYFMEDLKPLYEESPNTPEVFREVLKTLLVKGCDKNDEFMRELIVKDSLYIIEIQDSLDEVDRRENPDNDAKRLLKDGLEDQAILQFEKALSMDISTQRKASSNYYLARIYHSRGGGANFAKARTYYEKAAELKPDWGDPYYQIGIMYASSGPLCGKGTGWNSQRVIWPATDIWNKAIATGDEEAAAKAREKIAYYKQFLPYREEAFQRSIKEGDSYTVPCWIQRTTTVRLRSQF